MNIENIKVCLFNKERCSEWNNVDQEADGNHNGLYISFIRVCGQRPGIIRFECWPGNVLILFETKGH